MNSSFRELFYSHLTATPFHSLSLKVQMASFSPGSVAVPQVCTAILGTAHCWETTNTNTIGTVAVAEHPSFAKHNRTEHPKLYSRGRASNFSLKTYDLRSYPQSQQINLRLLP